MYSNYCLSFSARNAVGCRSDSVNGCCCWEGSCIKGVWIHGNRSQMHMRQKKEILKLTSIQGKKILSGGENKNWEKRELSTEKGSTWLFPYVYSDIDQSFINISVSLLSRESDLGRFLSAAAGRVQVCCTCICLLEQALLMCFVTYPRWNVPGFLSYPTACSAWVNREWYFVWVSKEIFGSGSWTSFCLCSWETAVISELLPWLKKQICLFARMETAEVARINF